MCRAAWLEVALLPTIIVLEALPPLGGVLCLSAASSASRRRRSRRHGYSAVSPWKPSVYYQRSAARGVGRSWLDFSCHRNLPLGAWQYRWERQEMPGRDPERSGKEGGEVRRTRSRSPPPRRHSPRRGCHTGRSVVPVLSQRVGLRQRAIDLAVQVRRPEPVRRAPRQAASEQPCSPNNP